MPFSQGHVLWLLQWSFCMCSLSWAGLCFFGLILSQSWGCFCHVGPVVKHVAVTSSAPASFLPLANQSSLVCPASVQILLLCCRVDNTILQNVFSLGKKKTAMLLSLSRAAFHVQSVAVWKSPRLLQAARVYRDALSPWKKRNNKHHLELEMWWSWRGCYLRG